MSDLASKILLTRFEDCLRVYLYAVLPDTEREVVGYFKSAANKRDGEEVVMIYGHCQVLQGTLTTPEFDTILSMIIQGEGPVYAPREAVV